MSIRVASWVLAFTGVLAPAAAHAALVLHPDNPRYLLDTRTGAPVLIAGFGSIVPSSEGHDAADDVAGLAAGDVGYARVWHLLPWDDGAIWPWDNRTGIPSVHTGRDRWDLTTWNARYFTRLRDALLRADAAGMIAEPHLFDRVGMSPASHDRWARNPWASDNNVNDLETPPGDDDGTPEFYEFDRRPNLRRAQEAWVRRFIDATVEFEGVIYEIENEHWELDDPVFADHYARFVKSYLAEAHGVARLVSYSSLEGDLEAFFTRDSVDIVNRHYGGEAEADPLTIHRYLVERWHHGKAVNVDEFANGVTDPDLLRRMCWITVTSGGHFHIEDALPESRPLDVVANVRAFLRASRWDFVHAAPAPDVAAPEVATCMEEAGEEVVCYASSGGALDLRVADGRYDAALWDPVAGGSTRLGEREVAGGRIRIEAPRGRDVVVHLVRAGSGPQPEPPVLAAPGVREGAVRADGDDNEWGLDGAAAQDVVRLGVHDGVAHAAGHWSDGQYPPRDATDHAVTIAVRHDARALYVVARVRDADVRTEHPPERNWANDCVEVYLDPALRRATTRLAQSTSEVQLVVDARGQVNAYEVDAAYRVRLLAGVTAVARRTAAGYIVELAIDKAALAPQVGAAGAGERLGVDFMVRDDDAGGASESTAYTWADPTTAREFPSKVPARWGVLVFGALPVDPGPTPSPTATTPAPTPTATPSVSATATATASATARPTPDGTATPRPTVSPGPRSSASGCSATRGVAWTWTWGLIAAGALRSLRRAGRGIRPRSRSRAPCGGSRGADRPAGRSAAGTSAGSAGTRCGAPRAPRAGGRR
jgi:hypothetical protein